MRNNFVIVGRQTPMLLPPDMRDWVDDEDMVHFVIEAVERLPLECFKVNQRDLSDGIACDGVDLIGCAVGAGFSC